MSVKDRLTAKAARLPSQKPGYLDETLKEIKNASDGGLRELKKFKSNSPLVKSKLARLGYKIEDTGLVWHITW